MQAMSATQWFRENIRARMAETGMTQAELARRAQTYQPNINRILSGEEKPSLDRAEKIATALGSRLSHLLDPPLQKNS
jgi:transcriptional regulator with XRE-family HTH domain